MSTNSDAESWVFPQRGAASPPLAQSSVFGPVALNDVMILSWTPVTATPEVDLYCTPIDSSGTAGNQTGTVVSYKANSPYTFTWDTKQQDTGGSIVCHMALEGTSEGNTVVWEFTNTPNDSPVTFKADSVATTSASSTSSSSSSSSSSNASTTTSSSSSQTSSASTTKSASASVYTGSATSTSSSATNTATGGTGTNKSSGLSTGAKGGIAVSAVGAIAIIAGLILLFFLRRRRNKLKNDQALYVAAGPPNGEQSYQYTGMAEVQGDEQHGHMVLPPKFNPAANVQQQQAYPAEGDDAAATGLLHSHLYGGGNGVSPHQSPQMAYTDVSHPSHVSEIDTKTPSVPGSYVPYNPAYEMGTEAPMSATGAFDMYAPTKHDSATH